MLNKVLTAALLTGGIPKFYNILGFIQDLLHYLPNQQCTLYIVQNTPYAKLSCWDGSDLPKIFLHSGLLFTREGLLAIFYWWSYCHSVHVLCYGTIQELCLCYLWWSSG